MSFIKPKYKKLTLSEFKRFLERRNYSCFRFDAREQESHIDDFIHIYDVYTVAHVDPYFPLTGLALYREDTQIDKKRCSLQITDVRYVRIKDCTIYTEARLFCRHFQGDTTQEHVVTLVMS